jgi:tubby-related protein 1
LGKVRSNFLGTEFYLYDNGKNEKKAKDIEQVREQYGVVQYETNVLGSKGPRRMKVILPKVNREGTQFKWKSLDVKKRFYLVLNLLYRKMTILLISSREEIRRT